MLLRRVAFPDFCEPCLPSPAAKPPENIEFREADMEALGYPDASFSNAVALSGAQINPFKTVPV